MARARNIKPGFFKNEGLVELPFSTRLLFAGLWTIADREGRLEDRPKRIKMDIFPGDNVDIDKGLDELEAADERFITRYEVDGRRYIQINQFLEHQHPHHKEVPSTIPKPGVLPPMHDCINPGFNAHAPPDKPSADPSLAPTLPVPARLIPDSLNLIPDSGFPDPDSKPVSGAIGTSTTTAGAMAVELRLKGVEISSQEAWISGWIRDGFSVEHVVKAATIAMQRPSAPKPIRGSYLDPIVRDPNVMREKFNPKAANAKL